MKTLFLFFSQIQSSSWSRRNAIYRWHLETPAFQDHEQFFICQASISCFWWCKWLECTSPTFIYTLIKIPLPVVLTCVSRFFFVDVKYECFACLEICARIIRRLRCQLLIIYGRVTKGLIECSWYPLLCRIKMAVSPNVTSDVCWKASASVWANSNFMNWWQRLIHTTKAMCPT